MGSFQHLITGLLYLVGMQARGRGVWNPTGSRPPVAPPPGFGKPPPGFGSGMF